MFKVIFSHFNALQKSGQKCTTSFSFGYLMKILHFFMYFVQYSEIRDKQASREGLVGTPGQRSKIRDDPGKYGTSGHPACIVDHTGR